MMNPNNPSLVSWSFFKLSIWNTAFRAFFLFGALHSAIMISLWLLNLSGVMHLSFRVNPVFWHSYELVFGFTRAILYGFLFTASQNWVGKTYLKGFQLSVLFFLWFVGRFAAYSLPDFLSASFFAFDIASSLMAVVLFVQNVWIRGQERNRILTYSLVIFLFLHLSAGLNLFSISLFPRPLDSIHLGIFSLISFLVIIGARILPFFTGAVIPNHGIKPNHRLEILLPYFSVLLVFSELIVIWVPQFRMVSSSLFVVFGVLNLIRLIGWKSWKTISFPVLWILHIAYFWISIGAFIYALSGFGYFPTSSAYHSLTIGAIGLFVFGMITRVSLGHTGRSIVAHPLIVAGYYGLNLAVLSRVFLPLFGYYSQAYWISGLMWVSSFLVFFVFHWKILTLPRIDGRAS